MGRGMQIAVLVAAVTGSVGGGLAALLASSDPPARRARKPVTAASAPVLPALPTPAVVPPPVAATAPDPRVALVASMKTVLTRVAAWAPTHAGEPCPDVTALGVVALDPWGRSLALTCSDQPADQIVGAISAGPDGIVGSDDDVPSWTLGSEITGLVRGARWKPPVAAATRSRSAKHRKDAAPTTGGAHATEPARLAPLAPAPEPALTPAKPTPTPDAVGDDIPARR